MPPAVGDLAGGGVLALLPAAGMGLRLGSPLPKALVEVAGRALVLRAAEGLLAAGAVHTVVVAAPPGHHDHTIEILAPLGGAVRVIPGGAERADSVRLVLAEAAHADDHDVVLVHDAARAFTPPTLIRAVIDAVRAGAPAAVPGLPIADTIKRVDAAGVVTATVDRAALRAVQTPQGFRPDVLRRAHALDGAPGDPENRLVRVTDDAELVERLGLPVTVVPGDPLAFKITTAFDLMIAEAVAAGALTASRADRVAPA